MQNETRPRVVQIIHDDGPGGGPGTVISHLAHFQARYDIHMIHGGSGRISEFCTTLGIPHHRLPLDRQWKLLLGFPLLVLALLRLRPAMLVLHGQWAGLVGSLAGWLARVPRMIYVVQWPAFYTDWDLRRVVRNYFCERVPAALCDRVVALSPGNYYQFLYRRWLSTDRLKLLSNSIDLRQVPEPAAAAEIRRMHGWADDVCHVVSVGRLDSQKHVDWLLEAWALVCKVGVKAHLWIVGDGVEKPRLMALAGTLGIEGQCTFLGSRPHGIAYIAAADIVAMTSMYEGHANVPLEAMACGRPIVANRVDGVAGSFTEGQEGFQVVPADVETFARRLVELICDPAKRARMGAVGRESVQRFERSRVLARFQELYEQVLSEPPRRRRCG